MPELGEIKRGRDIGIKSSNKFIWHTCIVCGKERWVLLFRNEPKHLLCKRCNIVNVNRSDEKIAKLKQNMKGEKNHRWKGGRIKKDGYVLVRLQPDDFFFPMATTRGRVLEHRLVVAKAIGRNLQPWEIVHHKEGFARNDNRYPETLQIVQEMQHNQITILSSKIKRLENQVEEQGKLIKLLQWQIKELKTQPNRATQIPSVEGM